MSESALQKFFKSILGKTLSADIEAESRLWMMQCPECKFERSVWEMGGVRWKAAGNPRKLMPCPNCGKKVWMLVYKKI